MPIPRAAQDSALGNDRASRLQNSNKVLSSNTQETQAKRILKIHLSKQTTQSIQCVTFGISAEVILIFFLKYYF
jgi:hypothetical protein